MEVREANVVYPAKAGAGIAFIRTDAGEIPADWSVIELGRIALSVRSGATQRWESEGPFPTYGSTGVIGHCDFADYSGPSILVARVGANAGKLNTVDGSYGVTDNTIIVRVGGQWSLEYIHRQLEGRSLNSLSFGSGQPLITGSQLKQLAIAFPPAPEQQAITEALADADALIKSLSLLLSKKRQIKQGAMQELLTSKKRLPGFHAAWKRVPLGRLLSVRHGRSQKLVECESGEYPILASGGQIGWARRFVHDKPSVLIGRKGTIDEPQFMDAPFWSVDTLFYTEIRHPNVAKFLFYTFCLIDWMRRNEASGVPSLSAKVIESIEIDRPERDEQQAIADALSDMDTEINGVQARFEKVHQLKQGMMQALLTGRIRLVQSASNVVPLPLKPAATHLPPQAAHNWQINEAVVIGVLAQRFGSEKFPLPRKRRVKLMYLLHRHAEGRAKGYLKKVADPYDPNTKYRGPETIALKNGYVRALHNGTYEGFVAGDEAEQAQRYFEQWYGTVTLDWLDRFHYRKTDDLELLATVDMAMVDLAAAGQPADVAGVKRVIVAHPEWLPKLSRELFSDKNIARALAECASLFTV